MNIALDLQSTLGHQTGIGRGAANLLAALKRVAPQHAYVELTWGRNMVMRLDRRLRWQQWHVPRRAKLAKADLLHVPGFDAPLYQPCPTILTVHDLIGMLFPVSLPPIARFYWSKWLPFTVHFATHLLADSEHTARDIIRLLQIPPERITVVPFGVAPQYRPLDHQPVQLIRQKYQLPEQFILFVSTLEPRKGLDTLVQAFARLQYAYPNLNLVLVGQPGWYTERLFAQTNLESLRQKVIFTGYVPDDELVLLYNAATLLAFPSRYEGFGLTVLEAMACGTPVVCSNSSSLPEVAGDAAIMVPPDQSDLLAQAIRRVLDDELLRQEMRHKGLAQAARFTWEQTAQKTLAVYEKVLSNARDH